MKKRSLRPQAQGDPGEVIGDLGLTVHGKPFGILSAQLAPFLNFPRLLPASGINDLCVCWAQAWASSEVRSARCYYVTKTIGSSRWDVTEVPTRDEYKYEEP